MVLLFKIKIYNKKHTSTNCVIFYSIIFWCSTIAVTCPYVRSLENGSNCNCVVQTDTKQVSLCYFYVQLNNKTQRSLNRVFCTSNKYEVTNLVVVHYWFTKLCQLQVLFLLRAQQSISGADLRLCWPNVFQPATAAMRITLHESVRQRYARQSRTVVKNHFRISNKFSFKC